MLEQGRCSFSSLLEWDAIGLLSIIDSGLKQALDSSQGRNHLGLIVPLTNGTKKKFPGVVNQNILLHNYHFYLSRILSLGISRTSEMMSSCLFSWQKCSLCFWIKNDQRGGRDDNRGQWRDRPVGLSPALLTKPLFSLWEKPLQTWWSWCIRTLMVHAADLSGRWVHSNNTHCVCLHPWDNLMRMYPLSDDSGGRAAACSCCHQGFNHSPLSAWHTQGTAASAGILMALLQHSLCSTHATTFVFCSARDWNFSQTFLHNCSLYVHKRPESMLVPGLERWLSLEQLQNELPVHFICSGCSLKGRPCIKYWRGTRTTSPQEFYLTSVCQPECTLTCALRESKKIKFCLMNVLECSLVKTSAFTSSGLLPLFFWGHVRIWH